MSKLNTITIQLITTICLFNIYSCQSKCNQVKSPNVFNDCNMYSQEGSTVCCIVKGLNVGEGGTACMPMDIMFTNRSLIYTTSNITGTLICGNEINNLSYFSVSIFTIFSITNILLLL
jgi:hypothetical protein